MNALLLPTDHPENCPNVDTLAAFNDGRLTEVEMGQLAVHVETCARCEKTLWSLLLGPADSFEAGVVRVCGDLATTVNAAYARMEAAAKGLCDGGTLSVASARAIDSRFELQGPDGMPYTIIDVIGRGAMGVVYRAVHKVLDRTVALKTLPAAAMSRVDAIVRFRIEGRAVARLDHPNIVRLYDFGESEGAPYFSMELVEGKNLAWRLAKGPMDFRAAAELVRTLALAIDYAHQQKVLHRDLKPSNVLIANDATPKIADFGLAKVLDDTGVGLTDPDAVMGTPNYMPPEQAGVGSGEVGPWSDVYSLGAILYETLVAVPPFQAENKTKVLALVKLGNLEPPSRLRAEIPRELEQICLKCLELLPHDRYSSANGLAQALGHWLEGKPERTRRPSCLRRWVRKVRRRRRTFVMLIGTLVVGGVIGATAFYSRDVPDGEAALVRRELEGELEKGKPVILVGEKGWPKWFRWLAAKPSERRVHIEPDGVFSAEMLDIHATGLLELLPDTKTDRYKLTAQLRHDRSDLAGCIGLYVAQRSYPRQPRNLEFFTQVTFNAVNRLPEPIVAGQKRRLEDNQTPLMRLALRLHAERGEPPNIDSEWGVITGPRMHALGTRNGQWHDLEMTVTPEGITAFVNGNRMDLSAEAAKGALRSGTDAFRVSHPQDPFVSDLRLEFAPRGGLGLVVYSGAVSIRRVTVTPLETDP